MDSKRRFYRNQARYYTNLSIQTRARASIHLEDKEDEGFWRPVLEHFFPHDRFFFISHSKSYTGNEATGCTQCLAYREYLNKRFLVCIDSDYRYIYREADIDIDHFIFQTYTYSFENHLCISQGLDMICQASCGLTGETDFDFNRFWTSYSSIIYELFAWHIALYKHDTFRFSISNFMQTITAQTVSPADNASVFLNTLREDVEAKIAELAALYPDTPVNETRTVLQSLGITSSNAYLYVRGHNMFSLCCLIGKRVCDRMLNVEKEKLGEDGEAIGRLYDRRRPFDKQILANRLIGAYPEIRKIDADMRAFSTLA